MSLFVISNLKKARDIVMIALCMVSSAYCQDMPPPHHDEGLTNIYISADPRKRTVLESTEPSSVMSRTEILKRAETSLGETVQYQPGVSSSYFGPASSRPVIRGNGGERVRVMRNGIGTLDISNTSEDHQVAVNPLTAESIEVLRGPETLLFGSSAIGGVVNVTDGTIPERPIGREFGGEIDLRGETADQELTGAAKLEGQVGKFNWHFSTFQQNTGNIDIPGYAESKREREQEGDEEDHVKGVLPNSFSRAGTLTAGGSYVWEKGFWGVSVTRYDSRYGIPGHEHEDDEEEHSSSLQSASLIREGEEVDSSPLIDLEQQRIESRGEIQDVSDTVDQVKFRFGGSRYNHSEIEGATAGTVFDSNAYEGRIEATHNTLAGFHGVFGTQFESNDFSASGEEAFVPDFKTRAPAVFVFEEYALTRSLDLLIGGRYEFNQVNPVTYQTADFQPFSASTGLSWNIDGLKKYVAGITVAYTERAPTGIELFADGIHAARQIFERGDSDLQTERSTGVDLTFKKNDGVVTGGLNLFAQEYKDYINLSPSGESVEGFDVYNYTPISARFVGFELENTFHVHELTDFGPNHFDLGTQFDYVRAKNLSDEDDLPRIPPFRAIVRATYDWKERLFAGLEGVFVAAQHDIAQNELITDDYQLLNFTMSYKLRTEKKSDTTIYLRANNLTDDEARTHSSFIKDLAPLAGRSFMVGLNVAF